MNTGGHAVCSLLDAELALDRIDAELAAELPGHVRGFAHAHAAGLAEPAAPYVATRPGSLVAARRALVHAELMDRALVALRLIVSVVIESDASVAAFRDG